VFERQIDSANVLVFCNVPFCSIRVLFCDGLFQDVILILFADANPGVNVGPLQVLLRGIRIFVGNLHSCLFLAKELMPRQF